VSGLCKSEQSADDRQRCITSPFPSPSTLPPHSATAHFTSPDAPLSSSTPQPSDWRLPSSLRNPLEGSHFAAAHERLTAPASYDLQVPIPRAARAAAADNSPYVQSDEIPEGRAVKSIVTLTSSTSEHPEVA